MAHSNKRNTGWHLYRLHLNADQDHERRLRDAIVIQYGPDDWQAKEPEPQYDPSDHPGVVGSLQYGRKDRRG